MEIYQVKSPILFLVFNRPEYTKRVFEQIKKVKPKKLYVSADGPRSKIEGEQGDCDAVRAIFDEISWPCEVIKLFRKENLGCRINVSTSISWFFEQEPEGIILEDDCLPNISFFRFCDEMLDRYRQDHRIGTISGTNHHNGISWGEGSYYFSQRSDIWGWASWRRTWANYDVTLKDFTVTEAEKYLKLLFDDAVLVEEWLHVFKKVKVEGLDTWDYQFHFLNFVSHTLAVIPNKNLISNIGFGAAATHTYDVNSIFANLPTFEMDEKMTPPKTFLPQVTADYQVFDKEFRLSEKHRQLAKERLFRRKVKRWWKNLMTAK